MDKKIRDNKMYDVSCIGFIPQFLFMFVVKCSNAHQFGRFTSPSTFSLMSAINLSYPIPFFHLSQFFENVNTIRYCCIIIMMIILVLLIVGSSQLECYNGGVAILTRTRTLPHSLQYQCLCPFDYYGDDCIDHKMILCQNVKTRTEVEYPSKVERMDLTFTMNCYLVTPEDNSTLKNYFRLPVAEADVVYQQTNYNIDQQYQIIWANNTAFFDQEGNVKLGPGQTEHDVLGRYPPYTFHYPTSFLGVPLSKTFVVYTPSVIRYINHSIVLENVDVELRGEVSDGRRVTQGSFSMDVDEGWEEFGIIKFQLVLEEVDRADMELVHQISMSSAKWRLVDPNRTKGDPYYIDSSFPVYVWMVLFTILFALTIFLSRTAIRAYKSYRKRKQLKLLNSSENNLK